jgi:hypothetical protein
VSALIEQYPVLKSAMRGGTYQPRVAYAFAQVNWAAFGGQEES